MPDRRPGNIPVILKGLEEKMPLYKQIAARLEYAIATGRIQPGAVLPSLREAQEEWGVNLHTVRRAYRELERLGLVRIQDRIGATVLLHPAATGPSNVRQLLVQALQDAEQRFGVTANDVFEELGRIVHSDRPRVVVAECSATLCETIARQIRDRWDVVALNHPIDRDPIPSGTVVSTLYHYQELVDRAGNRVSDLAFVHTRIAAHTRAQVAKQMESGKFSGVILCSRNATVGCDVAAELNDALKSKIDITIETPTAITRFVAASDPRVLKVVSPRSWDHLAPEYKRRADVVLLDYDVLKSDLLKLGKIHGWPKRDGVGPAEARGRRA